jgi:2-polyprenyl-3-methyl-5-hydroxy-6-metoxy-1,4-benzoquinol methylase
MSEPVAYASLPPTPMMQSVGLSFSDVIDFARDAIDLIRENGDRFLSMIENTFKAYSAITSRDLSALLAALADGKRDLEAIIAAIRETFGV